MSNKKFGKKFSKLMGIRRTYESLYYDYDYISYEDMISELQKVDMKLKKLHRK